MRITLLQRPGPISSRGFSASLNAALSALKGDLSASASFAGFSRNGWAIVDVTGEDQEILLELVSKELGAARTNLLDAEKHGNYDGLVVREIGGNLEVDVGIERPKPANASIKLSSLRAQLADGRPLSGREIAEHYCLVPGSKVRIRLTHLNTQASIVEGWLADSQIKAFSDWITTRLDRIQVFDCTLQELESATRRAKLERDIVAVEPLTLTAHSVVCKLGTDAIGLLPKLGSILRGRELNLFLPRRILTRCKQW